MRCVLLRGERLRSSIAMLELQTTNLKPELTTISDAAGSKVVGGYRPAPDRFVDLQDSFMSGVLCGFCKGV